MFVQFENPALIGTLAFKDAGRIMHRMGENMGIGVLPWYQRAIQPDMAGPVIVTHFHGVSPHSAIVIPRAMAVNLPGSVANRNIPSLGTVGL
jgi:hypothetical protein